MRGLSVHAVRSVRLFAALAMAGRLAAGCSSNASLDDSASGDDDASTTGDGGSSTPHHDAGADASKSDAGAHKGADAGADAGCVVQGNGVPANVAAMLGASCTKCHSDPPQQSAPDGLVTYADLTATSQTNPAKTVAAEAIVMMQQHAMPPGVVATSAEIATLQAWVTAGTPEAMTCSGTAGGDAGPTPKDAGSGGGTDAGDPYGTPPGCTSGVHWTASNGTGPTMRPGEACISCHARNFAVAGTVYPTAHEDTDCNGDSAAGLQVLILNSSGQTQATLTPNQVGNFTSSATLTKPYTAKVVDAKGNSRQMTAPQTTGDCNSCHTESGANGAPGRIMAP